MKQKWECNFSTADFTRLCHRNNLQPVCKSFLCKELALSHRDQGKACFRVPLYLNSMRVRMRVRNLFGGVNDTEWRLQSISFISWSEDVQSRHLHTAFVSLSRSGPALSVSYYRRDGAQTTLSLSEREPHVFLNYPHFRNFCITSTAE